MWKIYRSSEDKSVNYIREYGEGKVEARFVQREPSYYIVYLSSQSGCRQACRFCHLTATGQTTTDSVDLPMYLEQARIVVEHAKQTAILADRVHYNFMARGEPLENTYFLKGSTELFSKLGGLTPGMRNKFKVSTIIPATFKGRLEYIFEDPRAKIYYSLYSMDSSFRKRWLPKAMDPERALDMLADYQARTSREIALHWAFIDGENDDQDQLEAIIDAVRSRGLRAKFNLVRYNPFSPRQGEESSEERINEMFERIRVGLSAANSRIVPRVGFDVKASCGMFM